MSPVLFYTILFLLLFPYKLISKDIEVSENGKIKSLKEALEISADGDEILIREGRYFENNLLIEKHVKITGTGNPVIDANNISEIIRINCDGVEISGIIFKSVPVNFLHDLSAIRVENSDNVKVYNNTFENCFFAIYLANTNNSTVFSNTITGNSVSESFSGNGIHLWNCNNITINDNKVKGQRDGIYFEFVKQSLIYNNTCNNNLRYGLHFMFSEGNSYKYNTFRENGAGVAVMYTKYVEMIGNTFENNWGSNSYGLLLKDIDKSTIKGNYFKKNTTAIYIEGSNGTTLLHNEFRDNGWAIKIMGDCYEDTISKNNFFNNSFDVATNSYSNPNTFINNYWDRYTGYDINNDGTGDVPYRPVSLFSTVVQNAPETILLMRSFIVDLLDITEKVIPIFTPETLSDNSPTLNPIKND
jgi:nitrous oxidase accessory protein